MPWMNSMTICEGNAGLVDGRLSRSLADASHLRTVFYRMGLTDKDIVALSGAHTLVSVRRTD